MNGYIATLAMGLLFGGVVNTTSTARLESVGSSLSSLSNVVSFASDRDDAAFSRDVMTDYAMPARDNRR